MPPALREKSSLEAGLPVRLGGVLGISNRSSCRPPRPQPPHRHRKLRAKVVGMPNSSSSKMLRDENVRNRKVRAKRQSSGSAQSHPNVVRGLEEARRAARERGESQQLPGRSRFRNGGGGVAAIAFAALEKREKEKEKEKQAKRGSSSGLVPAVAKAGHHCVSPRVSEAAFRCGARPSPTEVGKAKAAKLKKAAAANKRKKDLSFVVGSRGRNCVHARRARAESNWSCVEVSQVNFSLFFFHVLIVVLLSVLKKTLIQ